MLTGLRGRPRKMFHFSRLQTEEQTQFAYMAEVSLRDAIRGPEAEEWYSAMASELRSIIQNNIWKHGNVPETNTTVMEH